MNNTVDNIKEAQKASFYHKGTNGKAIFLLHGFTGCLKDTEIFLHYLKDKGYSVISPYIKGYSKNFDNIYTDPEEWLKEARKWLEAISKEVKEIILVGFSFGGNMAVSLAQEDHKKVKGVVVLETPVFFASKIDLALRVLRPLCSLFGVSRLKKSRIWYRTGYNKTPDSTPFIPIEAVGKIYKFIKNRTKKNLDKIKIPCLIIQAKKSDMIKESSAVYLFKNILSSKKETYFMDVDNHDFNLLDEKGRILMLEKVHDFIADLEK